MFPLPLLIAVGVAFGGAVAVLVLLWRRASSRVELERAERLIEDEFDRLER